MMSKNTPVLTQDDTYKKLHEAADLLELLAKDASHRDLANFLRELRVMSLHPELAEYDGETDQVVHVMSVFGPETAKQLGL